MACHTDTRQRRVRTHEICIPCHPFSDRRCCFCFPISLSFSFLDVGLSCFNSALSVDNYSLSRFCFPSSVVEKKTTVYSHPSNLPPPRIGGANALPIVCGQYYPYLSISKPHHSPSQNCPERPLSFFAQNDQLSLRKLCHVYPPRNLTWAPWKKNKKRGLFFCAQAL